MLIDRLRAAAETIHGALHARDGSPSAARGSIARVDCEASRERRLCPHPEGPGARRQQRSPNARNERYAIELRIFSIASVSCITHKGVHRGARRPSGGQRMAGWQQAGPPRACRASLRRCGRQRPEPNARPAHTSESLD